VAPVAEELAKGRDLVGCDGDIAVAEAVERGHHLGKDSGVAARSNKAMSLRPASSSGANVGPMKRALDRPSALLGGLLEGVGGCGHVPCSSSGEEVQILGGARGQALREKRGAAGEARSKRGDHCRLDRQRMNRNFRKPARRGHALLGAPKIERAFQAERPQHFDIGLGKVSEMVGTEDLPPADKTAVSSGIAAKIAEITGAGEVEMAGAGI